MRFFVIAAALLVSIGCGESAESVVAELEASADAVCACTDVACADEAAKPGNIIVNKWTLLDDEKAKMARWSDDHKKRFEAASQRTMECERRIAYGE